MPPAPAIVVLADDLSGAAELANIAFAHGLATEIRRLDQDGRLGPASAAGAGPRPACIAIDTDSRHLPGVEAAARLRQLAEQIIADRPAWLFKKVDSLLRGNVAAEIDAILAATAQPRALLLPANPSRGRTVVGGQYLIDGIPLDKSPLADDFNHPRTSSDVKTLLGDAGAQPLHFIDAEAQLPARGLIVPNIASPADLQHVVERSGTDTLVAGAADSFAAALLRRLPVQPVALPPLKIVPPALLVCGSRVSWPARRANCLAAGIPLIALDAGGGEASPAFSALAIGIGERPLAAPAADLLAYVSQLVGFLVSTAAVKTLLIEGGATAAAIADHFHWTRFAVAAAAPAGIGVLAPLAENAPCLLIKPGSYPWPPEIWQSFCDFAKED